MSCDQQVYEQSPYGAPAPVEMEMPRQQQVNADGRYGGNNSYISVPAQSYVSVSQPAEYAGPEGDIPVVGITDPKPYS